MKFALLATVACLALCGGHGPEHLKTDSYRASPVKDVKSDALLGRWVCVGDNGGGFIGAIMEFRADGTVKFTYKGKSSLRKFKREPGREWIARRKAELGYDLGNIAKEYERPGVEMVYFQESEGEYLDSGGNLLMLVPDIPMLANILTQAWSRPGDEKRVTEYLRSH